MCTTYAPANQITEPRRKCVVPLINTRNHVALMCIHKMYSICLKQCPLSPNCFHFECLNERVCQRVCSVQLQSICHFEVAHHSFSCTLCWWTLPSLDLQLHVLVFFCGIIFHVGQILNVFLKGCHSFDAYTVLCILYCYVNMGNVKYNIKVNSTQQVVLIFHFYCV